MLTYSRHLLPLSATQLERVISAAGERVQAIPTPLDTIKRPDVTPPALLPFLAWEYSVDVWKTAWPVGAKRTVTGSWFLDHATKGTRRTIARYCGYVGSELLAVHTPPGKCFASPAWDAAAREAWLRLLPQLRIYAVKQRGRRGRLLFAGSMACKSFLAGRWPMPSTARFRLERRASLWLDGITTAVDVDGLGPQADRVRIRGVSAKGCFCNAARQGYLLPTTAPDRVITLTFVGQPSHGIRFPVRPGLEIKSVIPEPVFEHGFAPCSGFCGATPSRRYLVPSEAPLRVYSRVALWNRDLAPPSRRALAFLGRERLGMPAHRAEVKVSIPGRLPARAVSRYLHGHLVAADRERWADTLAAIRSAKRLSDRIKLNARTYRPVRVGTTLRAGGSYPFGRWTRS